MNRKNAFGRFNGRIALAESFSSRRSLRQAKQLANVFMVAVSDNSR